MKGTLFSNINVYKAISPRPDSQRVHPGTFMTMSHQETQCRLLEQILLASKKIYLCPLCHIPYSEARTLLTHCRERGKLDQTDVTHRGLGTVNTKGDFGSFLTSFGIAVGWEDILVENLPLSWAKPGPREYGACFKVSFIVDAKTRLNPSDIGKRFTIMRDIAKCAAIHYTCPLCMKGFANPNRVLEHCSEEKDHYHKGLLSEEQSEFLKVYKASMGQHIECDTMKIQYNEYGRPYFGECFQLDEILNYKRKTLFSNTRLFY